MQGHLAVTHMAAEGSFITLGIPLLDDGFDPDEMDILDHDENYLTHIKHREDDTLF